MLAAIANGDWHLKTPNWDFRVCGNYCGPHWCGGKHVSEAECDFGATPTGCMDACCKLHDACCEEEDRDGCNAEIVRCIDECPQASTSCVSASGAPVLPLVVSSAMQFADSSECGQHILENITTPRAAWKASQKAVSILKGRLPDLLAAVREEGKDTPTEGR